MDDSATTETKLSADTQLGSRNMVNMTLIHEYGITGYSFTPTQEAES